MSEEFETKLNVKGIAITVGIVAYLTVATVIGIVFQAASWISESDIDHWVLDMITGWLIMVGLVPLLFWIALDWGRYIVSRCINEEGTKVNIERKRQGLTTCTK